MPGCIAHPPRIELHLARPPVRRVVGAFAEVAGAAEDLEVGGVERQLGVVAARQDVVDLDDRLGEGDAAALAACAVVAEHRVAQLQPAR